MGLKQRKILKFWLPLAATWLMMAVEGPFLAAVIARLGDPEIQLAAFGVAFAFALILEAPVIMMMSASTALVKDRESFRELYRFAMRVGLGVTALMTVLLVPAVFRAVAEGGIGLPPTVAEVTWRALLVLLPWPGAIGYRRFYHGLLISSNLTRRVAYGTVVRLTTMASTALVLAVSAPPLGGAAVAGIALSAGVSAEALMSRIMAAGARREVLKRSDGGGALGLAGLLRFYLPLALTSLLGLGVQPVVTFFVGHAREALASLAVLPVVTALVFVFRALGLAYQEVVIALVGDDAAGVPALRRFALTLGVGLTGLLALIAATPAARLWFEGVSGLTPELAALARIPTAILIPIPAGTVWLCFERGILVARRRTTPVTHATGLEVGVIIAVLWMATGPLNLVGATAAGVALLAGRVASTTFLAGAEKWIKPAEA